MQSSHVHILLQQALWEHSRISVRHGKTQIWNRVGEAPRGWRALTAAALLVDPEAVVWRGDPSFPPLSTRSEGFGNPIGTSRLRASPSPQFHRSPEGSVATDPLHPRFARGVVALLRGIQSKLFAGVVPPDLAFDFAAEHDLAMRGCLSEMLGCEAKHTLGSGQLAFLDRRLRLAERTTTERCSLLGKLGRLSPHGAVEAPSEMMTTALTDNVPGRDLEAAVTCRERLLEAPSWEDLQRGAQPRQNEMDDGELGVKKHGWQFGATQKVEDCFLSGATWPRLSMPSRALLRSQGGPMAWHSRFDAQPFQILLLRRLWLQLLSSVRNSPCGLSLDSRGHHRAACTTAVSWVGGVLLWRARRHASVERRAPSVSRTWITPVASFWTISVRTRCATVDGASLEAAFRRKEATYPELTGRNGRNKLVLGCEVGGRWSTQEFLRSLANAKARSEPAHLRTTARQAWRLRWAVMLACTAAKAVALSLLERPGGLGSDGATPTTS